MMATRGLSSLSMGVPAGAWRWAALFFRAASGACGSLFLFAVWPKESLSTADARRVAEAAARANIAWAITGGDGAVLECNDVYRKMSGAEAGQAAPPPELALAGEPSAAGLYRLTRAAAEGKAREESFAVSPGIEVVAAVRPLKDAQSAWWFA